MFLLASLAPAFPAGMPGAQVKTVVIPVQGMVCVACAGTVKAALKSINGVSRVEVSLEKRTAEITYAPEKASRDQLIAAINKAGYKAGTPKEVQ
jgi:copper chaperone CopZ